MLLSFSPGLHRIMQNTRSIKELLRGGGTRLASLGAKAQERSAVLHQVRAALPAPLAERVVSAGVLDGTLSLGVAGAAWASRLRYAADSLRHHFAVSSGVAVRVVRIRVVPPSPTAASVMAPCPKVAPARVKVAASRVKVAPPRR